MIALIVVVSLAQAPAAAPEVFVDRAETYVRIGFSQGLVKGATVEIISADKRAHLGTAVVMEVWDSLARVNLDAAAAAYKGPKIARTLAQAAAERALVAPADAPVPPPPAPAPAVGKVPAGAAARAQQGPANGKLTGRVNLSHGAGDARRVLISNDDGFDWHACRVALPDGRTYDMTELKAHSDEGIMMFRFEPGNALRDPQGMMNIRCQEGDGRYVVEL